MIKDKTHSELVKKMNETGNNPPKLRNSLKN